MRVKIKEMKTVKINGKEFLVSEPFNYEDNTFIGREKECAMIMAAWTASSKSAPLNPLLTGEPGTGKNRIVYECARISQKPLFIMQGNEDLTPEDLACTVRVSDDKNKKFEYVLSPLVTAMLTGSIVILDEIGKMRPKAMAMLSPVLDERRSLISSVLGLTITAHPEFRFIAATNTADMEGNLIPEYIQSRLYPIISIDGMSRREIEEVVKARYRMPNNDWEMAFGMFWSLYRKHDLTPTPRAAISVFALAAGLSGYNAKSEKIMPVHIEEAFSRLPKAGVLC